MCNVTLFKVWKILPSAEFEPVMLAQPAMSQPTALARLSFVVCLPYFFGYKTEFFSFLYNPKDLDLSYKTDLDLWDCLGRVNLVL